MTGKEPDQSKQRIYTKGAYMCEVWMSGNLRAYCGYRCESHREEGNIPEIVYIRAFSSDFKSIRFIYGSVIPTCVSVKHMCV